MNRALAHRLAGAALIEAAGTRDRAGAAVAAALEWESFEDVDRDTRLAAETIVRSHIEQIENDHITTFRQQ